MAFRFEQLTHKSQEAVQRTQEIAKENSNQRLEPMHLLAALLEPTPSVARAILEKLGVNPGQIQKAAIEGIKALPKVSGGELTLGPELSKVLDTASDEAKKMGDDFVSIEHLILGLVKVPTKAQGILTAIGVNEQAILN
ncbi:MAG: Clp protease N-terminal domain-containing protein, partial [bacterium]